MLDGGGGNHPTQTCIADGTIREIDGTFIAAQCCDPNDPSPVDWNAGTVGGCRRYTAAGGGNTNAGCFSGKPATGRTYLETEEICAAAGLAMCDRTCAGGGCHYNRGYVWTNLACDLSNDSTCPHKTSPTTSTYTLTLQTCDLAGAGSAGTFDIVVGESTITCLLYTSPSPRDATLSRMPSSA